MQVKATILFASFIDIRICDLKTHVSASNHEAIQMRILMFFIQISLKVTAIQFALMLVQHALPENAPMQHLNLFAYVINLCARNPYSMNNLVSAW